MTPVNEAPATRCWAPVAVVAIVLGILGMHAITLDVSGMSHGPTMTTSMAATTADVEPATAATDPVGEGTGMSDMAMTCVAMLAAAAVALLMLVWTRRIRAGSWALPRARGWTAPRPRRPRATGAGPPPVWEFSVIRC